MSTSRSTSSKTTIWNDYYSVADVNEERWHLCRKCNHNFRYYSDLANHLSKAHDVSMPLNWSPEWLDNSGNYGNGEATSQQHRHPSFCHGLGYTYSCPYCRISYTTYRRYQQHMYRCHNHFTDIVCDDCGEDVKFCDMEQHAERHAEEWRTVPSTHRMARTCSLCQLQFANIDKLKQHLTEKHSVRGVNKVMDLRNHICQLCGSRLIGSYNFESHMSHHSVTHSCKKCGQSFPTFALYSEHLAVEEAQVRTRRAAARETVLVYVCESCSAFFTAVADYKLHVELVHSVALTHKQHGTEKDFKACTSPVAVQKSRNRPLSWETNNYSSSFNEQEPAGPNSEAPVPVFLVKHVHSSDLTVLKAETLRENMAVVNAEIAGETLAEVVSEVKAEHTSVLNSIKKELPEILTENNTELKSGIRSEPMFGKSGGTEAVSGILQVALKDRLSEALDPITLAPSNASVVETDSNEAEVKMKHGDHDTKVASTHVEEEADNATRDCDGEETTGVAGGTGHIKKEVDETGQSSTCLKNKSMNSDDKECEDKKAESDDDLIGHDSTEWTVMTDMVPIKREPDDPNPNELGSSKISEQCLEVPGLLVIKEERVSDIEDLPHTNAQPMYLHGSLADKEEPVNGGDHSQVTNVQASMVYFHEPSEKIFSNNRFVQVQEHRPCRCGVCGLSFNTTRKLGTHVKEHSGFNRYKCETCTSTFGSHRQLTRHIRCHINKGPEKHLHECPICHKTYSFSWHLKEHLAVHMDDPSMETVCKICGTEFKEISSLHRHMNCHTKEVSKSLESDEKQFRCKFEGCGETYSTRSRLASHVRQKHSTALRIKCTMCDKTFYSPSELRRHNRIHTGEKPFACGYCTKSFALATTLSDHVRAHTGERPFKCTMCPKTFTSSSILGRHKLTHLRKKIKCHCCEKTFVKERSFSAHIQTHGAEYRLLNQRMHTGQRSLSCTYCPATFSDNDTRYHHVRAHKEWKANKETNAELMADQEITAMEIEAAKGLSKLSAAPLVVLAPGKEKQACDESATGCQKSKKRKSKKPGWVDFTSKMSGDGIEVAVPTIPVSYGTLPHSVLKVMNGQITLLKGREAPLKEPDAISASSILKETSSETDMLSRTSEEDDIGHGVIINKLSASGKIVTQLLKSSKS